MGDNRNFAPMSPMGLLSRLRNRLDKLVRLLRGDKRNSAPINPMEFSHKLRDKFMRFIRPAKGFNRY